MNSKNKKLIQIYFLFLSSLGILFFGVITINLILDTPFMKLDRRKIQENESIWSIIFCFLSNLSIFLYCFKQIFLKNHAEIERAYTLLSSFMKKEKESQILLSTIQTEKNSEI